MNSSTPMLSHHRALTTSMPTSAYYLARLSSQHQEMFAASDHGFSIPRHLYFILLSFRSRRTHRLSQAEACVSNSGEESTHRCTMAGRIFNIAVTNTRHEYVIIEVFDVSESRDIRYGMPAMRASSNHGYHTVLPSVSHTWP